MQIPLLRGIYADGSPTVRVSYPVNMIPVPGENGIASGHLRPADGIAAFATGQGIDRGAIVWNGTHYRVSGQKLISVSSAGVVTVLGDIPGTDLVRMDYSFDRLSIVANGHLYYLVGTVLSQVVDADIGTVNDALWVDGYFMATDGTTIAITELADPTSVSPLKYGSSEADPDAIQCLQKVQNEVHVVNRHTIEVLENVGGDFFPFARVKSALITKGAIGRRAACVFKESVAFVGGARNEALGIYLGRNAQTVKISTREVDRLLMEFTDAQLADALIEPVVDDGAEFLFVHLPDRTIVYDAISSGAVEQPVWFVLTTSLVDFARYRARNIVRANGAWIVGDPLSSAIGRWNADESRHYGVSIRWEFGTLMLRNSGKGALINQLELVALTGAAPAGTDPMVTTSYSLDGRSWSMDKAIRAGARGDTAKRLVWFGQGAWRNWRVQRFRGDSDSRLAALSIEAQIEALAS